jgi:adenylyltransferase/sulfurtransferase
LARYKPAEDVTPTQLRQLLDTGEPIIVVDVREPFELRMANLEKVGAVHIPLGQLPERMSELDPAARTVMVCHTGNRSARAAQFLAANGFERVHNLSGGIDGWSKEVDPDVPLY